jgi:hypothetical protein
MAEEKDEEIPAKSSYGMTAEETEEMERGAEASQEKGGPQAEEEEPPTAQEEAAGESPSEEAQGEKKGSWLFR